MNDLIAQLEQLVDSGSERVKAMFAELESLDAYEVTRKAIDEQERAYARADFANLMIKKAA